MMFLLPSHRPDSVGDAIAAVEVKVENDGRIFVPADLRQRLGVKPGDTLLVDVTDEGILFWTRAMAADALQGLVPRSGRKASPPVSDLRGARRDVHASADLRPHGHSPRSARGRG